MLYWTIEIWYKGNDFLPPHQRDADESIISETAPTVTDALLTIPGPPMDGDMVTEQEDEYFCISALAHFRIKKTIG